MIIVRLPWLKDFLEAIYTYIVLMVSLSVRCGSDSVWDTNISIFLMVRGLFMHYVNTMAKLGSIQLSYINVSSLFLAISLRKLFGYALSNFDWHIHHM